MTKPNGFFFRKTVGGTTVPTWRTSFLVGMMPGFIWGAGAVLLYTSLMWVSNAVETTGTVTMVASKYTKPANGTEPLYSPVFSYTGTDGTQTIGALALASPEYNFEIGSEHAILYDPEKLEDIRLPGFAYNYLGPTIILAIGAMFSLMSMLLWLWVKAIARKRDLKKD